MCSNDFICFYDWVECRLIRRIDVNVKVSSCHNARVYIHRFILFSPNALLMSYNFLSCQNLYWADSGDLVAIASDASFYILKYNVSVIFLWYQTWLFRSFGIFLLWHWWHNGVSWWGRLGFCIQREVVASYLESGRPEDEQGVEDAFELLHETNERVRTGIWVGDCFIYNNSSWRLNYCVGGEVWFSIFSFLFSFLFLPAMLCAQWEIDSTWVITWQLQVTTMFHLDRPMYLLGYLASQSRVYLIDKEFK